MEGEDLELELELPEAYGEGGALPGQGMGHAYQAFHGLIATFKVVDFNNTGY